MPSKFFCILRLGVALLQCIEAVDWTAWVSTQRVGVPLDGSWSKLPFANEYQELPWEGINKVNAYRYFYPGATHYTLGTYSSEKTVLNFWQPNLEEATFGAVGANIRAALYSLYAEHLQDFVINLTCAYVYYQSALRPLCEAGAQCPLAMLMSSTELPQRLASDRLLPLDPFFAEYLQTYRTPLEDLFQRSVYYNYQFGSRWMGVPFMSDTRLLAFNVTTFRALNLQLPPPHGRASWTWAELREAACRITEHYGVAGLASQSDWDEDAKLFMLMVQSAQGALFGTTGPGATGYRERKCSLACGREAIESFWKPMIVHGCLRTRAGTSYWDITDWEQLSSVAHTAVNPRVPPDVTRFSNYDYGMDNLKGDGLSERRGMLGMFTSIGLDEEIALAPCRPTNVSDFVPSLVQGCTWIVKEPLELSGCLQLALRLPTADTVAHAEGICEVLRCESASSLAVSREAGKFVNRSVRSKFCSDIWYADMPNRHTYLGSRGLVIPKEVDADDGGEGGSSCEEQPPGGFLKGSKCWRRAEGWRVILELVDPRKPYMRQANMLKSQQVPPPFRDDSLFVSSPLWRPLVRALSQGISSQYPNAPIPEYAEVEAQKPARVALLRSIYGNATAAESLKEACEMVDELLRPCNIFKWRLDPRCQNPRDGLHGCPQGTHFAPDRFGQLDCQSCPPGRYMSTRSVSPRCEACGVGFFANTSRSSSCAACAEGLAAATAGMSQCYQCPWGTVASSRGSRCADCPAGTYQDGNSCIVCPFGYSSTERSTSVRDCNPGITRMFFLPLNIVVVLLLTLQALLLPLLLGRPVPIHDIFVEDGGVVVQTYGNHRFFAWCPLPLRVQLSGTCHPTIESKSGLFHVKVRHSDELLLLDASGAHIKEDVECSRGSLRLRLRSTFLGAAVRSLPVGPISLVLDLCALCILAWLATDTPDAFRQALPVLLSVLASSILASLGVYWYFWRASFDTPLTRKRQHWRRKLHSGRLRSTPSAVDAGPARALPVARLCEFYAYFRETIRKRDMHYVVANLLNPLTEPEQLSYAELAGPVLVQWFVSHCWRNSFADLVESLRRLALSLAAADGAGAWQDVAYWICSFSNNQWRLEVELGKGDPMASSFNLALLSPSCKGTAMILDENAEPLRRSWCLFEVFQTCKLSAERGDYEGLLMCTPAGVLQKGVASVDIVVVLAQTLSSLRMEDAKASKPEDKIMIDSCVQGMEGGFGSVNRFVRQCIKAALEEAHASFEGRFEALVNVLDTTPSQSPKLLGRLRSRSLEGRGKDEKSRSLCSL